MKITVLSRYGRLGASSRLRMMQYFPRLEAEGLVVAHHQLLDDSYLRARYANRRAYLSIMKGYLGRVGAILESRGHDVIWIEKDALPWVPLAVESMLLSRRVPVVIDIDDAVFHRYDLNRNRLIKRVLGRKLDRLMQRSNVVMAGSEYLAERARAAGCEWVERIPTVVDLRRYPREPKKSSGRSRIVIGWIGSPATVHYLDALTPVLSALVERHSIRCIAVGARPDQVEKTPFEAVTWTEDKETQVLQEMDIGIMPIPDGPWERGKCGYKLIQYMACRVPVVGSAVGANRDIVTEGLTGFLAETDSDWRSRLEELIENPDQRRRMGDEGRRVVEQEYCLEVLAPRVSALLKKAAGV